jgi:hypothetical protein
MSPSVPALETGCVNVHSKLMVVDDDLLLVESANLNNRSMVLDTECNLAIDANGDPRIQAALATMHNTLLAEHLGCETDEVAHEIDARHSTNEAFRCVAEGLRATPDARAFKPHRVPRYRPARAARSIDRSGETGRSGRAGRAVLSRAPRTFPTRYPLFALDRIWVHPGERLVRVEVHRSPLAWVASDHYPLIAHLCTSP